MVHMLMDHSKSDHSGVLSAFLEMAQGDKEDEMCA